ncbi:homeobox-leucine zipper protein HDG2-like [Solanum pennellii]|uniref:Homeobox-leucine zipper protein HDG2-like n=1 Tax=Solanum pennellii TaxID=28526 RepID=A0ABM1FRL6_SOLPN|nr:homeobox-leucine zipper protein HDG2-like [Solanum pennellii]
MPAVHSRPANLTPPLVENDGTDDTEISLGQPSNMMDNQPNSMENVTNTLDTSIGQDLGGGDDHNDDQEEGETATGKRKRYHRHTQHQIQELEAYFKECPHPDDKQRKELSRELGLEPLQVKFWFQNKRTQMKNQLERHENTHLRIEIERMKSEMLRLKEALGNLSCPTCGGHRINIGDLSFEERQLRNENARLKEEIERISSMAGRVVGKSVFPNNNNGYNSAPPVDFGVLPAYSMPQRVDGNGGFEDVPIMSSMIIPPISEIEKPFIIELVMAAMDEFVQMAYIHEPLWFPSIENASFMLNEDEYFRVFPRGIGPRPIGFVTEATRDGSIVIMNKLDLVQILMNVNHWASIFSGIVSRASCVDVISTGGAGNPNGVIQVILAETQVASPQVPTREFYFARYCKLRVDGTWAIVDVSLDQLRAGPALRSRKRPSGCLIEDAPNGCSKVTWVEHVEVDASTVHTIYKPLVSSGLAFGAKRWLAALDRQCDRIASVMVTPTPNNDDMLLTTEESRKSVLKLAERMINIFSSGVSATVGNQWTTVSAGNGTDENVRIMTRKTVGDPSRPPGIVLSAATSFWLPIAPKTVFDYLRNENTRIEWDILSNGSPLQEIAQIANGTQTGNCVSLLRMIGENDNQSHIVILQESSTDPTGSYVIYAPVEICTMNTILNGGDPESVSLLPSGFAILPDGPPGVRGTYNHGSGGSLLTVAFQIMVEFVPVANISLGSVATVNNLIACTIERIKAALLPQPT